MFELDKIQAYVRSYYVELFPETIKADLLADRKFTKYLGIETDGSINYGDSIEFQRNMLFKAIRDTYASTQGIQYIADRNGKNWEVSILEDRGVPIIKLILEQKTIFIPHFWALHPDSAQRLIAFKNDAKTRNFTQEDVSGWLDVINQPSISNDEVIDLIVDLELCPYHQAGVLRNALQESSYHINQLIPENLKYYERFIGRFENSTYIDGYSEKELKHFFQSRLNQTIHLDDLLMCWHSSVSKVIATRLTDQETYRSYCDVALETFHPILLIACFEIGVKNFLNLEDQLIEALYQGIISTECQENLSTLCSLAMLVDGEISRLQLFKGKPTYLRRLASFTQAAFMLNETNKSHQEFKNTESWAEEARGQYFYSQSFLDLRTDPRWLPIYLDKVQVFNDLLGRVYLPCYEVNNNTTIDKINADLKAGPIYSHLIFLPGPLEGNAESVAMPDEFKQATSELFERGMSMELVNTLINTSPLWRVDDVHLNQLANFIESSKHELKAFHSDSDTVYFILMGLAKIACFNRSRRIAETLLVLSRIYRPYIDFERDTQNFLAMGLVAGAAFTEKDAWAEYIAQWYAEVVNLLQSDRAFSAMKAQLGVICALEPYLLYTCSRTLNILSSLSKNNQI